MKKDLSLTPGFSPVTSGREGQNRFNGLSRAGKPLKRPARQSAGINRCKSFCAGSGAGVSPARFLNHGFETHRRDACATTFAKIHGIRRKPGVNEALASLPVFTNLPNGCEPDPKGHFEQTRLK
jgi:hypothetical protein